jgi:hypothetical protein
MIVDPDTARADVRRAADVEEVYRAHWAALGAWV